MTDRKFTPPTEFPAEYVDGHGRKVTILGRSNLKEQPLVCFDEAGYVYNYTEDGGFLSIAPSESFDLHDKPKRITTWHNVYEDGINGPFFTRSNADDHHDDVKARRPFPRLCVYRIERNENGSNPEIFWEEE